MKKVIKNSKKGILMVAMMATIMGFANEGPFIKIENDSKRTSLTLVDVKEGNQLSIKDNNGVILYKELIQKTGVYTKGFDLTELPNGKYLFEVDKDLEINTIPFTVIANAVTFEKEKETVIHKPFVKVENDLVYITKLALHEEPLKINVYFDDSSFYNGSELVHSEKIEGTKTIERVYRLTGLAYGSYKIVFYSEGREYTKIIN